MIEPPSYIRPETWAEFVDMRRAMPRSIPFTEAAAKRILTKLAGYHADGWDVEYILGQAIECGWRSVFVPRDCPNLKAQRAAQARREEEEAREREARSPENAEARKVVMQRVGALVDRMRR